MMTPAQLEKASDHYLTRHAAQRMMSIPLLSIQMAMANHWQQCCRMLAGGYAGGGGVAADRVRDGAHQRTCSSGIVSQLAESPDHSPRPFLGMSDDERMRVRLALRGCTSRMGLWQRKAGSIQNWFQGTSGDRLDSPTINRNLDDSRGHFNTIGPACTNSGLHRERCGPSPTGRQGRGAILRRSTGSARDAPRPVQRACESDAEEVGGIILSAEHTTQQIGRSVTVACVIKGPRDTVTDRKGREVFENCAGNLRSSKAPFVDWNLSS